MKLLSFINSKRSSGLFVQNDYWFEEVKDKIDELSVNGICKHLGYKPIETHALLNFNNKSKIIEYVVVELFTTNIIYVSTQKYPKKLTSEEVKNFMSQFIWEEEYNAVSIEGTLKEGIESKSLTFEFLSRVLDLEETESTGTFKAEKIGFLLTFKKGVLSGFKLDNQLSARTRSFKSHNPELVKQYAQNAKYHWGEDYDRIFDEVNMQFEALVNTPDGFSNEYIELHREPKYNTINFLMLLVCHYEQSIDLDNFRVFNKGRYLESKTANSTVLTLGNFVYEFSQYGQLQSCKQR